MGSRRSTSETMVSLPSVERDTTSPRRCVRALLLAAPHQRQLAALASAAAAAAAASPWAAACCCRVCACVRECVCVCVVGGGGAATGTAAARRRGGGPLMHLPPMHCRAIHAPHCTHAPARPLGSACGQKARNERRPAPLIAACARGASTAVPGQRCTYATAPGNGGGAAVGQAEHAMNLPAATRSAARLAA